MNNKVINVEDDVRDGIESLPEMIDISAELVPVSKGEDAVIDDTDLDEALPF